MTDGADRWRELIHPDDIPVLEAARSSGGRPYEVEFRLKRASDQTFRWQFMRSQPIPIEPGGGVRWLAAAMDIDDRKRAEEALRFLERAGAMLSRSLDLQTTLETLLDLVVPEVGDWASINLRDQGGIKTIAARHRDPSKAHLVRLLKGSYYYNEGGPVSTPAVYRTGLPQLLANVSDDTLRSIVKESYFPIFRQMGVGSLIVLPIFSGETVIGSFGIVTSDDRRTYTRADLPVLEELARRAGFAIENAKQYEREHRVAEVLQEAALPPSLPVLSGFALDGFYQPGRDEAAIGGDWYDALVLPDGRLLVSIGDVAGSGLGAAVTMGSMRQVIRGVAYVDADPAMMLEAADRALLSEREGVMVTAFVGIIDPDRKVMKFASAGHLPPLLRRADGSISELHAAGLPLGYRRLAPTTTEAALLPAGSCLLLYTDGLVESSHDIIEGEDRLRRRFDSVIRSDALQPAKALVATALAETGARDDVAVLTLRIGTASARRE